jgi:hypothetical protein
LVACAFGLKARSCGDTGLPSWPTFSGVQTCPVLGSRKDGSLAELGAAVTGVRGNWASAGQLAKLTTASSGSASNPGLIKLPPRRLIVAPAPTPAAT